VSPPYLLDTSIASLLHPRKADQSLRAVYSPYLVGQQVVLSFQTVGELYLWADRNLWGPASRAQLESLVSGAVVIPPDAKLIRLWASVSDAAARAGRRLEAQDAWIVATAIRHSLVLVTHDRDMVNLPIAGLNVVTHLR
jgi:tRNA(fMet)-specific endonuclease VapC